MYSTSTQKKEQKNNQTNVPNSARQNPHQTDTNELSPTKYREGFGTPNLLSRNLSDNEQEELESASPDEANIIFGLSGRNKTEIENALEAGYRAFDGADTYGKTLSYLESAINDSETIKRKEIQLIYKVDETEPDKLREHLIEVLQRFDGCVVEVLIHKAVEEGGRKEQYLPILAALKQENIIERIGMGDDTARTDEEANNIDCYEFPASALYTDKDSKNMRKKLFDSNKPIYVYNIISTLKMIKSAVANGDTTNQKVTALDIGAFIYKIQSDIPLAVPIMSSKNPETMASNFEMAKAMESETVDYAEMNISYKAIEKGMENLQVKKTVLISEMDEEILAKLTKIAFMEGINWNAEKINAEDGLKISHEIKEAGFKSEDLEVTYTKEGEKDRYKLEDVIRDLQIFDENCHRVKAINFITSLFM
jgi:Aldo/keto reductase family